MFVVVLFGVDTHLEFVKAEAIDAVDVALCDDGLSVGLLDDAEDVDALMLAAHDHDDFDVSLGVPAGAIHDGAAAVCLGDDVVGNLFPLLADDLELDALPRVVDDTVGSDRVDDHEDETIDDLIDRVEQQP